MLTEKVESQENWIFLCEENILSVSMLSCIELLLWVCSVLMFAFILILYVRLDLYLFRFLTNTISVVVFGMTLCINIFFMLLGNCEFWTHNIFFGVSGMSSSCSHIGILYFFFSFFFFLSWADQWRNLTLYFTDSFPPHPVFIL